MLLGFAITFSSQFYHFRSLVYEIKFYLTIEHTKLYQTKKIIKSQTRCDTEKPATKSPR